MTTTDYRHRGINDVGEVDGSGNDVTWGNTQQSGVTLQTSTETAEVQTGQSLIRSEVDITSVEFQLVIDLFESALQRMKEYLGIPDAQFSGDLDSGSAERLDFTGGTYGTEEKQIFALGPGPSSTRRVEAARAKLSEGSEIQLMHDSFSEPSVTWDVLQPSSGVPLFVEDAV